MSEHSRLFTFGERNYPTLSRNHEVISGTYYAGQQVQAGLEYVNLLKFIQPISCLINRRVALGPGSSSLCSGGRDDGAKDDRGA